MYVYDVATGNVLRQLEVLAGQLLFSPSGHKLVTWTEDEILLWEVESIEPSNKLILTRSESRLVNIRMLNGVSGIVWMSDSNGFLIEEIEGLVHLWDVSNARTRFLLWTDGQQCNIVSSDQGLP